MQGAIADLNLFTRGQSMDRFKDASFDWQGCKTHHLSSACPASGSAVLMKDASPPYGSTCRMNRRHMS